MILRLRVLLCRLAAKEAELIRRQAELVCQQAAQSLNSTATTHTTAQGTVGPGGAYGATNTQIQGQDEQDAAAEAAARAELEQLAAQGIEGAKEALAELEAQTKAVAAQAIASAKEAKQPDISSFDALDEDAPYVSSDEDDETIRKRISMAAHTQNLTA
jgi:hypothetical protein